MLSNARMTFAYFCLGSLDLLQQLDSVVSQSDREAYLSWVYEQQLCMYCTCVNIPASELGGGFRGSPAACTVRLCVLMTGSYYYDIHSHTNPRYTAR